MRILLILLKKEFIQIFRDKSILPLILVMPIVQLLIMPLAADYDIRNITLAVIDHDRSPLSRELVSTIGSSGYFITSVDHSSYKEALGEIELDKADIILEIPGSFDRNITRLGGDQVLISANAINAAKAGIGASYLSTIITGFNNNIRVQRRRPYGLEPVPVLEITSSAWFNPYMNYHYYMVPGILVMLVTIVSGFMATLNIVREKEIGTIEQINVSPIRKHQFLLGKLIPFWIIGIIVFTLGLGIARLVYGIIPLGNIGLLYFFLAFYLIAVLGFGLLISTYTENQQQSMFVAFFFIMIFILMSGLFTSADSMPAWARWISRFNPVTYFVEVIRMVMLKGSGFADISRHFLIIIGFAVFFNGWAVWNYRKTS